MEDRCPRSPGGLPGTVPGICLARIPSLKTKGSTNGCTIKSMVHTYTHALIYRGVYTESVSLKNLEYLQEEHACRDSFAA